MKVVLKIVTGWRTKEGWQERIDCLQWFGESVAGSHWAKLDGGYYTRTTVEFYFCLCKEK